MRASIIKHASHSSGGWIKASCSKSMCFSKKNTPISNTLKNTFLSLPRLWDMLVSRVCIHEQRKQSFLTLAKENQSPLGSYRNPPTFFNSNPHCASNSWLAFSFVLSPRSSLITQCWNAFRLPQSAEVIKKCYYVWNRGIFLTKTHGFATGGLYSPTGAMWGTFYYGCACFI